MNCSEISCVLVRMMNAKKLRSRGQQEMACNALKAAVSKSAILHAFDPSLRLVLETDTSQVCTGAALYNVTEDGEKRYIALDSTMLSETQSRYGSAKRGRTGSDQCIQKVHTDIDAAQVRVEVRCEGSVLHHDQ